MNPDFSLRPFAVGSLTGVRSFRVTPEGVLTGVSARVPWATGVNEAICSKPGGSLAASMARMAASGVKLAESMWALTDTMCRVTGEVNLRKRPKPAPPPTLPAELPPHQAGTLDCTCGFYAYFDEGHNPHYDPSQVLGIIEGFGVCTTGTRGFRSSKARLRALVFTEPFRHYYPQGIGRGLAKAVQARYPDVPIFWSVEAALAEFPLTPVEGAEKPEQTFSPWGGQTFSFVARRTGKNSFDELVRAYLAADAKPTPPTDETPQARALRLRRERNTGPADVRGLDGRRRA